MNECQERGCRSLQFICKDCGRVANTLENLKDEWISVKDRLPEPNKKVLAYAGYFAVKEYESGIFYDGESHCYCPVGQMHGVTHWQPLRKPPNE